MFSILLVLLIIVAFLMTVLILLQKSDGTGLSGSSAASMLGGAMTGAAAGNFLTRATAWLATIFFVLCAALAFVVSKTNTANQESALHQDLVTSEAAASVTTVDAAAADVEQATVSEGGTADAGVAKETESDKK